MRTYTTHRSNGQQVIRYMNRAYEAAERGNTHETFRAWHLAHHHAGESERIYLETIERRALMKQAYTVEARQRLHFAWFIHDREQAEPQKYVPSPKECRRREERVYAWHRQLTKAYDAALEAEHEALLTLIREARAYSFKPFMRTRIVRLLGRSKA